MRALFFLSVSFVVVVLSFDEISLSEFNLGKINYTKNNKWYEKYYKNTSDSMRETLFYNLFYLFIY